MPASGSRQGAGGEAGVKAEVAKPLGELLAGTLNAGGR
jgi:hypothetical protein